MQLVSYPKSREHIRANRKATSINPVEKIPEYAISILRNSHINISNPNRRFSFSRLVEEDDGRYNVELQCISQDRPALQRTIVKRITATQFNNHFRAVMSNVCDNEGLGVVPGVNFETKDLRKYSLRILFGLEWEIHNAASEFIDEIFVYGGLNYHVQVFPFGLDIYQPNQVRTQFLFTTYIPRKIAINAEALTLRSLN